MAVSLLDQFDLRGKKQNFKRDSFNTIAEMVAFSTNYLPDMFETFCYETRKKYRYDVNNDEDLTLGKWREVGEGGLSDLPTASETVKGGIKIGENLTMTEEVLSADKQTEENFTTELKEKLDSIDIDTKVDKVDGKGLSTNDLTDELKEKYDKAEENVQSNWNQTDDTQDDFIQNKPAKLSEFENDSEYITKAVEDLKNYYLKTETYNKTEIDALVNAINQFNIKKVSELPEEGIDTHTIYFVPRQGTEGDVYDEYIYIEDSWERIGTSSVYECSKELTRAEYDALTDEERANGTVYFITDEDEEIDLTDTVEPAYNDIPVIYLDGELPPTKATGYVDMMLRYVSRSKDFTSYASVKLQGNQPDSDIKKSLNLKFFKDATRETKLKVNFRGWGKESQFTLSSDWYDRTHARNIVSSKIFTNIVKTRADFDDYPELFRKSPKLCQYDGFLVKMYLNGVYQGFYSFRMKKEDYTYNMTKKNENHHMIQLHRYTMANLFREEGTITMETDDDGYGITEELQDEVSEAIQTRWNEVIDFVKDSTDDEFKANIEDYFYLSSLIDAYVFIISGAMIDNTCNNHMFITYDGQKFIYCTYDMDSSWGATYGNVAATTFPRESFGDLTGDRVGNLLFIRLCECFGEDIYNRYCELREGPLSSNNIINEFEKFCIASREQLDQDYSEDTADGAYTSMKTGTEFVQLRNWVAKRFGDYCDSYFASLV